MARDQIGDGYKSLFRGKAQEHWAAGMFSNWLWVTARPDPDIGSDLFVEIPSYRESAAASFVIQARSHNRKVRTETIDRAAAIRLQSGILPAFLLSIHRESGIVRWAYIEPLFDTEPTFLAGGDLKIRLVDTQTFAITDSTPPGDFVTAIYRAKARGGLKATPTLRSYAQATEDRYREIDPNFVVSPSLVDGKEVMSLSARSEPVTVQLQLELRTPEHKASVRDALEWGNPAQVSDTIFTISGSPLFEHLSKHKNMSELAFVPKAIWEGSGVLNYRDADGRERNDVADVRVSSGSRGIQITAVVSKGLLTFTLRMEASNFGSAHLNVKYALVHKWKADELVHVQPALRVIEAASLGRAFLLTVEPPNAKQPLELRWSTDPTRDLDDATLRLRSASTLLKIAKQQDWALPLLPMQDVSPGQMRTIIAAEALLRGEHVMLPPTRFFWKDTICPSLDEARDLPLTIVRGHELPVYLGSDLLGSLPAWVMLRNYRWELETASGSEVFTVHFTPMENSTREYFPPDMDMPTP